MINQSYGKQSKNKIKKPPIYYELINSDQPTIKVLEETLSPQQLTERIVRDHKYLYLDPYAQKGIKVMNKADPQNSDQQCQTINNSCIINLQALSKPTQSYMNYLIKWKQQAKRKDQIRSLIKSQLEKPTKTKKKPQNVNRRQNSVKVYRGMDSFQLKKYLQQKQLQTMNSKIIQREREMVSKLGIISDYKSISKAQNQMPLAEKKKLLLPRIRSKSRKAIIY